MTALSESLTEHLRSSESRLIDQWLARCESDGQLELVSRLSRDAFRNNMPAALAGLREVLANEADECSERIKAEVAKHGHHRWKQGFNLQQVIRDWGILNSILVSEVERFLTQQFPGCHAERATVFERMADYLTEAMSESVRRFDDFRRAEAVAMARDLEVAKRQFEQVTHARGEMLREAAHDIRGGLTAIAGVSSLLRDPDNTTGADGELLDVLEGGVASVQVMLSSLLDLSRLESGADPLDLGVADVSGELRDLVAELRPMAADKELGLAFHCPDDFTMETDISKVRRIAQNLVINAIKYTHRGEVVIAVCRDAKCWTLEVRDTGPGMQDKLGSPVATQLDDVDEPRSHSETMHAGSYAGEGIGLTIVKRLCTLLEAGIRMHSERSRGTTFIVEFPLDYDHIGGDTNRDGDAAPG